MSSRGAFQGTGTATPLEITTTSLPGGVVGVAYSQSVVAIGGVQPRTFSVLSGALPAGLSLTPSTGAITGTPTTAETANFTIRVTDFNSAVDDQALSIVVGPALDVTTTTLPDAEVGVAYSQQLAATGGTSPYAWSVVSGLPALGLTLVGDTIQGTPIDSGSLSITVRATDASSSTDDQVLALTIDPLDAGTLTIDTVQLAVGVEGTAYSGPALSASGGTGPYTYSIVAGMGSMPSGLALATNGSISGTPDVPGLERFMVRVDDSASAWGYREFLLPVTSTTTGTAPTASLVAGNASGVAPLVVHADMSGSTCTGWSRPFEDLGYITDWGDPKSRHNWSRGPEAGHCYYEPGTYQVRTTITEPGGGTRVVTQSVTVTDPDTVFAGSDTICISDTADFTGAPAGATQVTQTNLNTALDTYAAGGKRVLFRRGGVFTTSTNPGVNVTSDSSESIIGAFGVGTNPDERGVCDNDPIFRATGDSYVTGVLNLSTDDLRIVNIRFEDTSTVNQGNAYGRWTAVQNTSSPCNRTHLVRCSAGGANSTFMVAFGLGHDEIDAASAAAHNEVGAVDCTVDGSFSMEMYWGGHRMVFDGCKIGPTDASHNMRVTYAQRLAISHCEFLDPGGSRLNLKIHETAAPSYGSSQYVCVTDCDLTHDTVWSMSIAPPSTGSFDLDLIEDVVVDGLRWRANGALCESSAYLRGHRMTLRNCVTEYDSVAEAYQLTPYILAGRDPGAPTANEDIRIFNMTVLDGAGGDNSGRLFFAVNMQEHTEGDARLENILVVTPKGTSGLVTGSGGTYTDLGNLIDPATPGFLGTGWDLRIGPDSDAAAAGSLVPVVYDHTARSMRAALASPDVGAFQVGVLILRVTTASLADGTVGVAYSQQLAAVNGTGDVDWSIEAGTLPAGLALDTETGAITGTPTAGGTSVLTFRATDSASPTPNTDDQVLSVTVNAAAVIDITTTTLPNGTVASAYSQTIAVTNAIGSVTWSLVSGSLPAGLSLNASTGEITGTPTTAGTSNFTARATDSANQDDQALSITVDEQVVPAAGDVDDFPLAAVAIATGMV